MSFRTFLADTTIGLASGFSGDKVMGPVTTALQKFESPQAKKQEEQVSPGVSYNLAAKQIAGLAGVQLDQKAAGKVGTLLHTGLGLAGGEMYMILRRKAGLPPIPAALIVSLTLLIGIDEGLTPLMGWSAPDSAYPLATHVRGLAGHLALGAGIAVAAEGLSRVLGNPLP